MSLETSYVYSRDGVATTAAVDFFEIVFAATERFKVKGLMISQSSDLGDAAEEILRYRFAGGNTTGGSGGASPDEQRMGNALLGDPSSSVASFNSTPASGGTTYYGFGNSFNIRAGEAMWFPPGCEPVLWYPASTEVNCVRLMAAPADSLTMSAALIIDPSPVAVFGSAPWD